MTSFFDTVSYSDVAKTIDHSLRKPELDDPFVEAGCLLAARYDVASVCVRPRDVARANKLLAGTTVAVGTVIAFPHGDSRTETKVFESRLALQDGARELDMVIDIGALISGDDKYVQDQIAAVVEVAHADYVKTSTGYAPTGATVADLKLMKQSVSPRIGIKAAHGIRTLDALLEVLEIGVTRVGATQTAAMLDEFKARKAGATAAAAR